MPTKIIYILQNMGNRSWIYFSVVLLPCPWLTFFALVFITCPESILPVDGLGLKGLEERSTPDLEIKQLRAAVEDESFETPGPYSKKERYVSNENPFININQRYNLQVPGGQIPQRLQIFNNPSSYETTEDDYISDINPGSGHHSNKHPPSNSRNTQRPTRVRTTTPQSQSEEQDYDYASNIPGNPDKPSNKPPSSNKPDNSSTKGRIILEETFSDRSWSSKWIYTKFVGNDSLKFEKFYRVRSKVRAGSKSSDYGLMTSNKGAEDYAISTTFPSLSSYEGTLVVQFSLQYQKVPHCEYVYLRLFDCRFKPEEFNPESPFLIQLGPNICGSTDINQVSVIMMDPFKSEKRAINQKICAVTSTKIHTYTLVIEPDGNFKILTNDNPVQNGTLKDVFPNYQGYTSICAVGLSIWHSVLDKFFLGQIIIDDILITTDVDYAEKRRAQILNGVETDKSDNGSKCS